MPLFERETIMGCHKDEPLMTRWKIIRTAWFRLCLHIFHRSDEDRELHNHPWTFVSLILWGGYYEVRPWRGMRPMLLHQQRILERVSLDQTHFERVRMRPGSLLIRPAWWAHRVEIAGAHPSVSLVLMFRKTREWGFFTRDGWKHWKQFTAARDCSE